MRIQIQAPHVEVSSAFDEQIRAKVSKLAHFHENIIDALIFLHENNSSKEVEIKLNVKSETLFVREAEDTWLSALDSAVEVMTRKVKKYKETTLKNLT